MPLELPELPYETSALEPYVSTTTIEFHYGKHHKAYVDNLNKLILGTEFEGLTLEKIIKQTAGNPEYVAIFNNAAQAWNHEFLWKSMSPTGGGEPKGELKKKIEADFGSIDNFKTEFKNAALTQFGSGWAWLVEKDKKLSIVKTSNAENPMTQKMRPILTLDVWEHAYYLDYQNLRANYVDAFLNHLINWKMK